MRNTDILRKLVSSQGRKISDALTSWWPTLSALGLFATFLTDRSTYFHPWYLLWVFVFIPFIQKKQLQTLLLFFSFSSLLRYVPWLYTDEYTADVLQWRVAITWGVPILLWMLYQGFEKRKVWHNLTTSKNHA